MTDAQETNDRLSEMNRRLTAIEADVIILKSTAGRVQLSPAALSLVWTALIALVPMAVFLARLDFSSQSAAREIARVSTVLVGHVEEPGHREWQERWREIQTRLDRLEVK